MTKRDIGDEVMLKEPQRVDLSSISFLILPSDFKGEVTANGFAKESYMVKFKLPYDINLITQVSADNLMCVID